MLHLSQIICMVWYNTNIKNLVKYKIIVNFANGLLEWCITMSNF